MPIKENTEIEILSESEVKANPHSPVIVQDVVVLTSGSGEFEAGLTGDHQNSGDVVNRLFEHICALASVAANQHKQANCDEDANLAKEKENNITRLLTNEFTFYTQQPLKLDEFESLMRMIADYAKKQPANLHLLLGSFAVLGPDNRVMNVVPQIECGAKPMFNCIVKNNPHFFDPSYQVMGADGAVDYLYYAAASSCDLSKVNINVDNQTLSLSFNNVVTCQAAGGGIFYSCIDICADHENSVARDNLESRLNADEKNKPTQYVYTVLANSVDLKGRNVAVGNSVDSVAYADPRHSLAHYNYNGMLENKTDGYDASRFGPLPDILVIKPYQCGKTPGPVAKLTTSQINTRLNQNAVTPELLNSIKSSLERYKSMKNEYGAEASLNSENSANEINTEQNKLNDVQEIAPIQKNKTPGLKF